MELVDKNIKTATRNKSKYLKKKYNESKKEIDAIFRRTKWKI